MLPKILRMRRELVLSPLVVLRGTSIALVAMCFPALCGTRAVAHPAIASRACARTVVGAPPRYPLQFVRSVRRSDPVPERTGKARAHVTVRPSRLFVG